MRAVNIPGRINMKAESSKSGSTRRAFLWQSLLALNTLYLYPAFGENVSNSSVLSLTVYDAQTKQIIPCSVALRTSKGELLTEDPGYSAGFRCPGEVRSSLPAGKTKIVVTRGFDYRAEVRELDLPSAGTTECEIHLTRISPLRKNGWVCGDNHIHMKHGQGPIIAHFPFLALTARAEAMDYMSVAQAWNVDTVTAENLTRECAAVSSPDCVLHWNMEEPKNYWQGDVSHCMGHCWNIGMGDVTADGKDPIAELFAMSAGDYQKEKVRTPNFDSHALIHFMGGIAAYTHPVRFWRGPWGGQNGFPVEKDKFVSNMAQELPFDTVAGPTYDTIDIMMQTRERLVNELGEQLWFMLLNQGYRMPATASTDASFDNPGRAIPGAVRVYTRIEGELTLGKVAKAMKAGKNFVTSGPLLMFTLGEYGIGDIVQLSSPMKLQGRVETWASGVPDEYLTKIEVIRNGQLFKTCELAGHPETHELSFEIEEGKTAWYIVKCYGSQWSQFAVSNPIYFEGPEYRAPQPTPANVELLVVAIDSSRPLDGSYEVIEMIGREPKVLNKGHFTEGRVTFSAPATARIRVQSPGCEAAMKSIFIDTPALLNSTLEIQPEGILDWASYEAVKKTLNHIQLKFAMRSSA
jgi:hypothetical protein